jgi:GT2 family glycosyltransferase
MIAIPTLSAGEHLNECLRSLENQTFRDFEVTVIDNGGNSFSVPDGLSYPCRVLKPGANVGFGAAINLAAHTSGAPLVATLNDDTEPDPTWMAALVREMRSDTRAGMCASRIRFSESGKLDSAGMLICLDGSSKQRGHGTTPDAWTQPEDVLLPSACAALYRRQMLEEVGYFDEDFFLYCEDTDLGLRAQWAGWGCRYAPDATVRHHYSGTAGAFSLLKARHVERNRLWVALKNFPAGLLILAPAVSLWRYFWQAIAVRRGRGAASGFVGSGHSLTTALSILVRAHVETLGALPRLLKKRRAMRPLRKVRSAEFIRLVFRHRITARELGLS